MRSENIRRNCRRKIAAELVLVRAAGDHWEIYIAVKSFESLLVGNIDHALRMSVSKVAFVWQPEMDFAFVQRLS